MKRKILYLTVIILLFLYGSSTAQETWTNYTKKDVLLSNWVQTMMEDSKGTMWIGTDEGLHKLNGDECETFRKKEGLPDEFVTVLMEDSKGAIWIGTANGITRYINGEFTKQEKKDGSPKEMISCMLEDSKGIIWVGSNYLYSYDGDQWTRYTEKSCGIYGVGIILIEEDSQHNLWVGSVEEKVHPGELAALQMGASYFRHGAIAKYDGSEWQHFNKDDRFPDAKRCVFGSYLEDSKGDIWFGAINHSRAAAVVTTARINYGSLMKYDGEDWTYYSHKNGLNDDFVIRVIEDLKGNIWIGTHRGINVFDGVSWKGYTQDDKLVDNWITDLKVDTEGNIWIGTIKGITVFDGEDWLNYTEDNGLGDNIVNTIHEDQNGHIWVGTGAMLNKGGGVSVFDGKNWTSYSKEDEVLGKVYRIEEDPKGNLWFITKNGMSRYIPESTSLQSELK